MDETSMDETKAREVIEHIARAALKLAVLRHDLCNDDGEALTDEDVEDIKTDVVDVMTGDDTGCLDESELTAETCELKWLLSLTL